jgi:acylphosphatase
VDAPESAAADGADQGESKTPPTAPADVPRARVHVLFSGQVQGVGFRYTARALAQRYRLVGFVRNLADGRVELEVEGSASEVPRGLEELQRAFRHYIRDAEVHWLAPTGEHQRFEVRFPSGW